MDDLVRQMMSGNSGLGVPAPGSMPTREKAQKEATERATNVLGSWGRLLQILERHEETIRKRWGKKTKVQRGKLILEAWPNMSATHRPDYGAFFKEGGKRSTKHRDAYLWPYMNLEDLIKGNAFLLLLNSRGRNQPNIFVHSDGASTQIGHVSGAIMPAFLNLHTMMLEGNTLDTFGRLIAWDEDDEAMDKCLNGIAHDPGMGLWILEVQERVLQFLVTCCQAILHDFEPNDLVSTEIPIKSEPPPLTHGLEYPTLASITAEAPYRVPTQIDYNRLSSLVSARLTDAEDHIRGLREDPGYISDVLIDWSEHREEQLLDTNKQKHSDLGKTSFWNSVICHAVEDAYASLVCWNIVQDQITNLAALQAKYSATIDTRETLPDEYLKALLALRYTIDQAAKSPIAHLKNGMFASPPFRSSFERVGLNRVQSKRGTDKLWWLFSRLWNNQQLHLVTLPGIMDEIEYVVQKDPKEKAKLSSWVAGQFSELGLMTIVKHELDAYQPWASGYDHAEVDHKEAIKKDFPRRFATIVDIHSHISEVPFAKYGCLSGGRFYYPSEKTRTKLNTDIMRKAESNLDVFWSEVDGSYRRGTGRTLEQMVEHLFKEKRQLERTPEWIEPVQEKKKAGPAHSSDDVSLLLSSHLHLQDANTPSRFVAPETKIKPKTTGISDYIPAPVAATPPAEDTQPKFTLKNRAFNVFRILFHTPSQTDLPGELSWADFLFAMSTTGFAPEKLYGSVWQFTPLSLDVKRSIHFHEPHPVAKIPFRNARRIGRRLHRAYGWHAGMFVLE